MINPENEKKGDLNIGGFWNSILALSQTADDNTLDFNSTPLESALQSQEKKNVFQRMCSHVSY